MFSAKISAGHEGTEQEERIKLVHRDRPKRENNIPIEQQAHAVLDAPVETAPAGVAVIDAGANAP